MLIPYVGNLQLPLLVISSAIASFYILISSIQFLGNKSFTVPKSLLLIMLALFIVFLVVIYNYNVSPIEMTSIILRWMLFMLIGVFCYQHINNNFFFKTNLFVYLLMILFALSNIDTSTMLFDWYNFYYKEAADYQMVKENLRQTITEFFCILSLLIFFQKDKINSILFFLILSSIVLTYILGGRGALLAYTATILFYILNEKFSWNIFLITPLILIAVISLYFIRVDIFALSSFQEGFYDGSFLERQVLLIDGLRAIGDNIFFGDYAGHLINGESGKYIHNFLSYYRQFGLVFFLLYIFLIINSLYRLRGDNKAIFYICIFLCIEILLFKSFTWGMEWMIFGFILCKYSMEKKYA